MSLVLDATPKGANANAYCDLVAAQAIIDATPNSSAWGVDPVAQTQAIVYFATLMQALAYQGVKTTVAQALAWPRGAVRDPDYGTDAQNIGYMIGGAWGIYLSQDTIPVRVIRANVMGALEVLRAGTSDIWGVDDTRDVIREKVYGLETEYTPAGNRRNVGLRRFPSVWRELYPLTMAAVPQSVERA